MEEQIVVGVVAKNSLSYVETVFDCYQKGEVVVLLRDPQDNRIQLTNVSNVIEPNDTKGWFTRHYKFSNNDTLAQIAFTSGTEGEPKGVLLTHRALDDVTRRLINVMEMDASIREYVGAPSNYSFGLGRFRAVSAVGGHGYLPEHGFNPLEVRDMLANGEINAVSAVPSLWRVLLKNTSLFGAEATNLKWIEIGSQYMSQKEKEQLKHLFPNAKITQHYGLTEASRTTFLRIDKAVGERLESVGTTYGNTEIKISESGRICVKGAHVSQTLIINGSYESNVDENGWFHTSDLGEFRDGFLYFKGRADDLINCGGIKLSPEALERDIRDELKIKEGIAVARVADEIAGNGVLVVGLSNLALQVMEISDAAYNVLRMYGVNNKNVIHAMAVDEFPVTATGKVQRKQLTHNFDLEIQRSSPQCKASLIDTELDDLTTEQKKIYEVWKETLKVDVPDIDSNFYELGGDSLSVIGALIEMEKHGVPPCIAKGVLHGLTIREIAAKHNADENGVTGEHKIFSDLARSNMVINIVRGIMVLIVITAHWHQGFIERFSFHNPERFTSFFAPVFAMGTPGFALIYGIGAGSSLLNIFNTDPARLKIILKKTCSLLIGGIFLMAAFFYLEQYVEKDALTVTDFTNSFYSVLTYYLLITATLYFWFKLITIFKNQVGATLILALLSYALHVLWVDGLSEYKTEGWLELLKLVFTAKYGYFLMTSGTLVGIAIGLTIRKMAEKSQSLVSVQTTGCILVLFGLLVSYHIGDHDLWFKWPIEKNLIWRWMFYAGIILVLIAWVASIANNYNKIVGIRKKMLQVLSIIGMLAFPLFVLHELVLPTKVLLVNIGIKGSFSLIAPMLMFFVLSYLMFRKLYKLSYI